MATYYNKNLIDGISELPRMTKAEFDELSLDEKPINWICRNYTGTQRGIKSSDVEHSAGVSVKDKLDEVTSGTPTAGTGGGVTLNWGYWSKVKNVVTVCASINLSQNAGTNHNILSDIPSCSVDNANLATIEPMWNDTSETQNKVARLYGNGIYVNANNTLASGKTYFIKAIYPSTS